MQVLTAKPIKPVGPLTVRITILTLLLCSTGQVVAQKDKDVSIPLDHFYVDRQGPGIFRKLISKLTFGLSTGYGSTTFRHQLDGFALHQPATGGPVLFNPNLPTTGFSNWFNRIEPTTLSIVPGDFVVNSNTAKIGFRSKSLTIPLQATVHVEFSGRYRIGGGYSFNFVRLGDFKPLTFGGDLRNFNPDFSSFFLKKYFLLLGASVYRYEDYLLTVDMNIGGYSLGKNFDKSVISKGLFFNLGTSIEREMSEYFRIFVRPSYEFKNYDLNFAEAGQNIKHRLNALYIHLGVTYRIPELRRCFLKECRIQINHAHGNREYRSRVHPIWKKQNPHYGENYPNLIKYKGKNKRRLNPY
ncbi:MAG: hypothetical protein ACK4RF_04405 [Cyclobacteriaceae bacterium]